MLVVDCGEDVDIRILQRGLPYEPRSEEPVHEARLASTPEGPPGDSAGSTGHRTIEQPPDTPVPQRARIATIAGEQFVASLTGEHYRHLLCR